MKIEDSLVIESQLISKEASVNQESLCSGKSPQKSMPRLARRSKDDGCDDLTDTFVAP